MDKILIEDLQVNIPEEKEIKINNILVNVIQYLPIDKKMLLISEVINNSVDDSSIIQPPLLEILTDVYIVKYYTNIDFDSEPYKNMQINDLYDILETNGIIEKVISILPETEYNFILRSITETSKNINTYLHSALGVLRQTAKEYKDIDLNVEDIQQKMRDPENLSLLKDVITKLG